MSIRLSTPHIHLYVSPCLHLRLPITLSFTIHQLYHPSLDYHHRKLHNTTRNYGREIKLNPPPYSSYSFRISTRDNRISIVFEDDECVDIGVAEEIGVGEDGEVEDSDEGITKSQVRSSPLTLKKKKFLWKICEKTDPGCSNPPKQMEKEEGEVGEGSCRMESVAVTALRSVMGRVHQAAEKCGRSSPDQIRVVAVSKTKPVSLIRQVYDAGHRCFGENYVQEIIEKAPQLPDDIQWHFIGHLQSKKVKPLLTAVPNLAMVESVDSEKVANYLDRFTASIGRKPLKVLVQVNTSGETSKFGVEPSSCVELAKHVKMNCPNLQFSGLMTIGMLDYTSTPENFQTLSNCRSEICKALGITKENCELSMGMSGDFEKAIEMGSTNVRIGSTIFGPREYPNKQA